MCIYIYIYICNVAIIVLKCQQTPLHSSKYSITVIIVSISPLISIIIAVIVTIRKTGSISIVIVTRVIIISIVIVVIIVINIIDIIIHMGIDYNFTNYAFRKSLDYSK